MAQALFLFRIAAGKLWEAKLALDEKTCAGIWTGVFVPLCIDGKARWKAWQRQISSASWVKALRDEHSFHYPRFDQWSALLATDALVEDDQVFLGEQSGNSFWAGSDNLAQHWMFGRMSRDAPGDAVDPMIGALIDLLGDLNGLVDEALSAFVVTRLMTETEEPQPVGLVASPDFRKVKLPFWTWMPLKAS